VNGGGNLNMKLKHFGGGGMYFEAQRETKKKKK